MYQNLHSKLKSSAYSENYLIMGLGIQAYLSRCETGADW